MGADHIRKLWEKFVPIIRERIKCEPDIYDHEDLIQEAAVLFLINGHKYEDDEQYINLILSYAVCKIKNILLRSKHKRQIYAEYSVIRAIKNKYKYRTELKHQVVAEDAILDLNCSIPKHQQQIWKLVKDGDTIAGMRRKTGISERRIKRVMEEIRNKALECASIG